MKTIKVGRSQENDIVLQNDPYASRTHCEFFIDGYGRCVLQDLNSTNGTFVNGQRVNVQTVLHHGDKVTVGNTIIPWETYFPQSNPTIVKPAASQSYVTPEKPKDAYEPSHKTQSGPYAVLTLLSGLAAIGIIIYIIVNYFTSFGYQVLSAFDASTFKGFVVYLHGWFGIGGQWFPIIVAIVLGFVTDLFGSLGDSDDNQARSTGLVLGNIAVTVGFILLALAIFAEKIVSM